MGVNKKIALAELKKAAASDIEELMAEVHAAVDNAPDGAIISGSEEAVREAMARFRERVYQKALQLKADAGASAFSPSDGPQEPPAVAAQGPSDGGAPDC